MRAAASPRLASTKPSIAAVESHVGTELRPSTFLLIDGLPIDLFKLLQDRRDGQLYESLGDLLRTNHTLRSRELLGFLVACLRYLDAASSDLIAGDVAPAGTVLSTGPKRSLLMAPPGL